MHPLRVALEVNTGNGYDFSPGTPSRSDGATGIDREVLRSFPTYLVYDVSGSRKNPLIHISHLLFHALLNLPDVG